jgi:hypothetical protein
VDRSHIEKAAADAGIPLEEHIHTVLNAMKSNATLLGMA